MKLFVTKYFCIKNSLYPKTQTILIFLTLPHQKLRWILTEMHNIVKITKCIRDARGIFKMEHTKTHETRFCGIGWQEDEWQKLDWACVYYQFKTSKERFSVSLAL